MPTPTDCRKCGRPYYGAAGLLCEECERDQSVTRRVSYLEESWTKEVMHWPKSEIVDLLKKVCGDRDHAKDCYINLHNAVLATIMENLHLADGDVCTLKILKDAIDFELPPETV